MSDLLTAISIFALLSFCVAIHGQVRYRQARRLSKLGYKPELCSDGWEDANWHWISPEDKHYTIRDAIRRENILEQRRILHIPDEVQVPPKAISFMDS